MPVNIIKSLCIGMSERVVLCVAPLGVCDGSRIVVS
jgi:hypothetical protein